jgi:uncharacterized membrane protein YfcA
MIGLALLATGLVAGLLGALLGLGGGVFLVPALTLLFGLPIRVAVGTSLMGVIATSAGVAAVAPRGRGADVTLALRLELVTAAGAIAGGLAAGLISGPALNMLFGLIALLTGGYVLSKARQSGGGGVSERLFAQDYRIRNWPAGMVLSSVAGVLSGLLGLGCGFIKVPVMYAVMGVPLGIATATSNFMVGITAAASVFVYYGRGNIHPMVVIPTVIGVFSGAMGGVYILPHLRVSWIRMALVGLLALLGVQMFVNGLRG